MCMRDDAAARIFAFVDLYKRRGAAAVRGAALISTSNLSWRAVKLRVENAERRIG